MSEQRRGADMESASGKAAPKRVGVLFVCLGNICRSPLAEGIFIDAAQRRGVRERFVVDSAGTGHWHVGERPDRRAIQVAAGRGIELPSRARQIEPADFERFEHIVCMDRSNRRNLLALGAPEPRLSLALGWHPSPPCEDVPDPYTEQIEAFERVYDLLLPACEAMVERMARAR